MHEAWCWLGARQPDVAEKLLRGFDPEKLSRSERVKLLPVAARLMEMQLRAERLELGLMTDHISNVRPPKPLEQMSIDELRAWRAKLELLSQV